MAVPLPEELLEAVARHWGFAELRPLQTEAIRAVLDRRDSLVVMPTGGGKSLCYQAPALIQDGLTVVVSPLIALMKDQVDGLARNGIRAIRLDSSLKPAELTAAFNAIRAGETKLVFVSPERLVNTGTHAILNSVGVGTVAIDECHCISHWGHDFRPEYRMLARLREFFPGCSVHAYTATATEQVRRDIIDQLQLAEPEIHIGHFDRPNLTYRVLPQADIVAQIREVLDRRKNEAGIVYCLRRADVDSLTATLQHLNYKAVPYHAGMTPDARRASHNAFASEEADIVVATIAFGMGIDRSNVRFVIHACVPKTIEHYQQETGRAGRDGLPSECLLLFSFADVMALKRILEKSANEANAAPEFLNENYRQLDKMVRYSSGATCRHKALVEHFDQAYESANCEACDICLGDTEELPDALIVAQKILSCVARVEQSFGVNHVLDVLRGANTQAIRGRGHEKLSTFGLLQNMGKDEIRDCVFQLLGQQALVQTEGDYPILRLNAASWDVMKGLRPIRLIHTRLRVSGESEAGTLPPGADAALFEILRTIRREEAKRLNVPPYQVFADSVLAEMARCRPTTPERMRLISGVGDVKLREFGELFLDAIRIHATEQKLPTDLVPLREPAKRTPISTKLSPGKQLAYALFREGTTLDDVVKQVKVSRGTVSGYLADFILLERPASIGQWLAEKEAKRIAAAAAKHGTAFLKPIFVELGEKVSYDDIRIGLAFAQSQAT